MAVPQAGQQITVDGVDYIVQDAFRIEDRIKKAKGTQMGQNISITAKRPQGKKLYNITQYPQGFYSRPSVWPN